MPSIKPQLRLFVNPRLPYHTRVHLDDGREGVIVDRADSRAERLVFFGSGVPQLTAVSKIVRGRINEGIEFTCSFTSTLLKEMSL